MQNKILLTAIAAAVAAPTLASAALVVDYTSTIPTSPVIGVDEATDIQARERSLSGTRKIGQSFSVDSTFTLDKFYAVYDQGVAGGAFTVALYEVDDITAGSFGGDANLVPLGSQLFTFDVTVPGDSDISTEDLNAAPATNGFAGVIEFDLTDADEVVLTSRAGNAGYALVFTGRSSTPFNLVFAEDTLGSIFPNGQASGNIGSNPGDLAISLVAVPEPASLALLGLGGLAMVTRRRTA